MGRSGLTATTLGALALSIATAFAAEDTHWGYEGAQGPEHWAALGEAYQACGAGTQQSPVDIAGTIEAELPEISLAWKPGAGSIVNNGHTIQVNVPGGSQLRRGDASYELLQVHFHAPSEHLVAGKAFPMEAHFVHRDAASGELGVLGVFLVPGGENAAFSELAAAFPQKPGEEATIEAFDPKALVPAELDYWTYAGSLTTPPCSETVTWMLAAEPVAVAAGDIARFSDLYPANARPAQPSNRRFILGPAVPATPQIVDVVLTDAGGRRFDLIREVRSLTGHSVRKSTALIDAAPRLLKGELPRDEAEAIKARLEGFGATVELK